MMLDDGNKNISIHIHVCTVWYEQIWGGKKRMKYFPSFFFLLAVRQYFHPNQIKKGGKKREWKWNVAVHTVWRQWKREKRNFRRFNHLARIRNINIGWSRRAFEWWETKRRSINVNIIWSLDDRGGILYEDYAHRLEKINFDENIKRDIFEFLLESFFLAYWAVKCTWKQRQQAWREKNF